MAISGIMGYKPLSHILGTPKKRVLGENTKDTGIKSEIQDKVEISAESMERLRESAIQEPDESSEEAVTIEESVSAPENMQGEDIFDEDEAEETESEKVSGSVGINAQKLARMLAAAKTRAQVRSVIALIQSDLKECDSGKAQGLDVDEASVKAAEHLLEQAKSQLSSAEDREATPEEELASAIASLM